MNLVPFSRQKFTACNVATVQPYRRQSFPSGRDVKRNRGGRTSMKLPVPVVAQQALVDFDRVREVLVILRDAVYRELSSYSEEQQLLCRIALGGVLDRFDAAVTNAHLAFERWQNGEIGDVALCAVTGEPARIVEEAASNVWYAASSENPKR